jgi:ribosome-binding protein aMBF1 (putative translation factor)
MTAAGKALMGTTTTTVSREDESDRALRAMPGPLRVEYDAASVEAEARLQLAELVYSARTAAGLSQTELARRAGTRQAVISAIENGAQAPGGVMLSRIAHALGGTLRIDAGIDAA